MTRLLKWCDHIVEIQDGYENWTFSKENLPWLYAKEDGLKICVTDFDPGDGKKWRTSDLGLRLEDLLPTYISTFCDDPDDIPHMQAAAQSLERMANRIRQEIEVLSKEMKPRNNLAQNSATQP